MAQATATPDAVLLAAEEAASFVRHPYWARMTRMLNGTIASEFEEMLGDDSHLALNRASVAVARKILRMPYIDIEQGKLAVNVMDRFEAAAGVKRQRE